MRLILAGVCLLFAFAIHAETGHTDSASVSRPLFDPSEFGKVLTDVKEKSLRCRPLKKGDATALAPLVSEFKKTGLPVPGDYRTKYFKQMGVLEQYAIWRLCTARAEGDAKKVGTYCNDLPLVPEPTKLKNLDEAIIHFSVVVGTRDAGLQGATGTGFLIDPRGYALTNFHNVESYLIHHPDLSKEQKKRIFVDGIDPKSFPNGVTLHASALRSGTLPGSTGTREGTRIVVIATPAFGRAVDLDKIAEVNPSMPKPEDPGGFAAAKPQRVSLPAEIQQRDWAVIKIELPKPARFSYLPINVRPVEQKQLEEKQMFYMGYPGTLFLFPKFMQNATSLPYIAVCWDDEAMNVDTGIAPDKRERMSLMSGLAGSGSSGSPVLSNRDGKVYGILYAVSMSQRGPRYRPDYEPPPFRVNFYPVFLIEKELKNRGFGLQDLGKERAF